MSRQAFQRETNGRRPAGRKTGRFAATIHCDDGRPEKSACARSETMGAVSLLNRSFVNVRHKLMCGTLQRWSGRHQTARRERTREALRPAALVRFLAQGVEDTLPSRSGGCGVSLRTCYRNFLQDTMLFDDYNRPALVSRRRWTIDRYTESIIGFVQAAIFAFRMDVGCRGENRSDQGRRTTPAASSAISGKCKTMSPNDIRSSLRSRSCAVDPTPDDQLRFAVTDRCMAAAGIGAMAV